MEEINLKWEKIENYEKIFSLKKLSGVYIWGFYNDPFIPYMVGKAKAGSYGDIKSRLWEHITQIMCGVYEIHKKENLHRFSEFKHKTLWDKLAHNNLDENKLNYFIKERYGVLKEHIDEMVNNFHFTYAIAEPNQVADLEKSVIELIGIHKLWNIQGGAPKEFKAIKEDLSKVIIV